MKQTPDNFPRLLYIGDVPVESTTGGSALLFRLLADYPKQNLRIMASNLLTQNPSARLEGVVYENCDMGIRRLLATRWARWYSEHLFRRAPARGSRLARRLVRETWRPQAVLTVAHGRTWLVADRVAQILGVPLHLIIHDDPFLMAQLAEPMRREFDRQFAEVFGRANSRLCVSPFMAEMYEKQFGLATDVLYPSRPPGGIEFEEPPRRGAQQSTALTYVFAGSVVSESYGLLLRRLAETLGGRGDRLVLFSNLVVESAAKFGLLQSNVTLHPIVPRDDLIRFLREQADVLYVPMSFAPQERLSMEISFPSKLADYTAVGLPLLIDGPGYCSAVKWAKLYPTAAEVVENPDDLPGAIARLAEPSHRERLAQGSIAAGKECFSYERVVALFFQRLCGAEQHEGATSHGIFRTDRL
jgi:hypothetical protein